MHVSGDEQNDNQTMHQERMGCQQQLPHWSTHRRCSHQRHGRDYPAIPLSQSALGAWLIIAPWLLSDATTASTPNGLIAGMVLIALSLPRGAISQQYAGWNQRIR
jgi:hypothetical protein